MSRKRKTTEVQEHGRLMMPDGSWYTRDSSVTGLNNNVAVIGPSGSGKTSVMGVLNALESKSSFVLSDPKGTQYRNLKDILPKLGYKVQMLDLTHPERSDRYNPLSRLYTANDIRAVSHAIVTMSYGGEHTGNYDRYWDFAAESMLCACIAYLMESDKPISERTLPKVVDIVSRIEPDGGRCQTVFNNFQLLQNNAEHQGEESWAYKMMHQFETLSEKTLSCVISTVVSMLLAFEGQEFAKMFSGDDFNFRSLGDELTAFFVIVSDCDRSNDLAANLFYTQAMKELCDYADNECEDGRLKVPVMFMLDDFATNCRIDNFENMISNIRARNISAMIMLQSVAQLEEGYGRSAHTIMNNCDTVIFMGANAPSDAKYFAERANKPLHEMLEMPLHTSWIFRRAQKPRFVENIDPRGYAENAIRRKKQDCVAEQGCDRLVG